MAGALPILIAGAGIGGLTAALALARRGFNVEVLEAAAQLQEIGAGIQLSPNASHILRDLGLEPALAPYVGCPERLRVVNARSGREIVTGPLHAAEQRYGAPFWVVHRADLQRVLAAAVSSNPRIRLRLGEAVREFSPSSEAVSVTSRSADVSAVTQGKALVGADGLWSSIRERLHGDARPAFAGQTAWRALVPTARVAQALHSPEITLWLGRDAHTVHYPVRGGAAMNVVVVVRDRSEPPRAWSVPGDASELKERVGLSAPALRELFAAAEGWSKWALYSLPPLPRWGEGLTTLLGDAAHPMLPFLAQGAAMAIEDAAILAREIAGGPEDVASAFRAYERARQQRTARAQAEAIRSGRRYGLREPLAAARDFVLRRMGGTGLLRRYDWLYAWRQE